MARICGMATWEYAIAEWTSEQQGGGGGGELTFSAAWTVVYQDGRTEPLGDVGRIAVLAKMGSADWELVSDVVESHTSSLIVLGYPRATVPIRRALTFKRPASSQDST